MILKNEKGVVPVSEFVAMMAAMMALVALSIDAVLPALDRIEYSLSIAESNSHLIISTFFMGLAVGQVFFGTLSDYTGRKPAVTLGIVLFIVGCLISVLSNNLISMLTGRLFQGVGLAGPRVVSIALVRDQYRGAEMARIMSLIMSIFIIIPVIAPLLGQGVLLLVSWHYIFVLCILVGLLVLIWFVIRQPETLRVEERKSFSIKALFDVMSQIVSNKVSFYYTIVAGIVTGMFLGFLSSIQPVFNSFNRGDSFALGFAILALFIGCSHLANTQIVRKVKVDLIAKLSLRLLSTISICFLILSLIMTLNFWLAMVFFIATLFCIGMLFGNLNALAMEPLGAVAGIGSSVVGSLSTFISVPIGIGIGFIFNNTITPLVVCYLALSLVAQVAIYRMERSNKQIEKCNILSPQP